MRKYLSILFVVLAAALGAVLAFDSEASAGKKKKEVELGKAEVFIEWNSSDTDFGIQIFWDGEPWERMNVENPDGKKVLSVKTARNIKAQGLTEGFFESAEPPAEVLSMAQFFARHPEGEYEFEGRTQKGDELVGEAEFTHDLPVPATDLYPSEGDVVSHEGFTLSFDAVAEDVNGDPLDIELFVVVVESEEDEPILTTFTVVLPPDRTSIEVPEEFLEPGAEYKLEIIIQEASGNRTITEGGTFSTTEDEE